MGAERAGGMHVVHQNEGRIGRATYLRIYGAFPPPRSRPLLRRTPTSPLPPSFVPSASYLSRTGRDDRATAWRSLAHRKKLASIPLLSSDIGASGGEGGRPPWLRFMLYRIIYERTDARMSAPRSSSVVPLGDSAPRLASISCCYRCCAAVAADRRRRRRVVRGGSEESGLM